ncbi:MAG: tetratricopeptide repeat protein [Bacteroidia bacterium]
MAKQNPKKIQPQPGAKRPTEQGGKKQQTAAAIPAAPAISMFSTFRQQSIFIVVIGFIIYFNSFSNKYALDDDIVMRLNDYVQQGFSGIGKIMSTDSYDSFFRSMGSTGELSGGRYRPLSIVTFAIEQQVFGDCYGNRFIEVKDSFSVAQRSMNPNPNIINKLILEKGALEAQIAQAHENIAGIRHVVSVFLYILSVVFLLKLLRDYIFKYANLKFINHNDLAFVASLIFLVHPIHTEVVANVKSRDEILSFLFIVLTFLYVFKYEAEKKSKDLWLGLLFFFLALLSKEWGITLVVLIPVAFFTFRKYSIMQCIKSSLPYFAVAVFYMILRYKFVGAGKQGEITEVLNNPYVYATPIQKLATEIFVLLKYIRLLIFPHPLSADYSWKTIPYNSFGDLLVWISIIVHVAIVYYLFVFLKKRSWIAFAIAFYLLHLFLVSNLAMAIGATMGERLVYHSSLGFVMIAAFLLLAFLQKIRSDMENKRRAFVVLLILLIVPMGYATIVRNPDWKTDNILFMHDAWVVPNSVLANGNSGKAFIELSKDEKDTLRKNMLLDSAIYHLEKAVALHPRYVNGYLNIGLAWFQRKDLDKAEYYWNQARKYFPTHPFFRQSYDPALSSAFMDRAKVAGRVGNVPLAVQLIARALKYDSTNAEIWYNYGGANFTYGNATNNAQYLNEAYRGWTRCLQLNPNHADARKGMEELMHRAVPAGQTTNGLNPQQQQTNQK